MAVKTGRILIGVGAAILVGVAVTCGYAFLQLRYEDRAAEGVLRRGIELAGQKRKASDTLVSLLPNSITHDTGALLLPYKLSFIDTYPYDASSYWSFFMRPAYVWLVCFETGPIYEGEVRHRRDGIWTVWLTWSGATQCDDRSGGA
jgi:hypothetical protein